MRINKIFFDLDGTLIDSKKGIINSLNYAFTKMNMNKMDDKLINKFIGPPLLYSLNNILKLSIKDSKKIIYYFRERYMPLGIYESKLFDGIKFLLNDLFNKKINLYIATAKPYDSAIRILTYFKIIKFFKKISACDTNDKNKNKNKIIFNLIENIKKNEKKINLKEIIMIGDRDYDIFAANYNKIHSIGVNYGYSELNELKKAKTEFLIDTIEELKKFLFKVI